VVQALREEHEVHLFAARIEDHRGTFGADLDATECGVPGWPSWLGRYRELTEVRSARRIAKRVIADAQRGWTPDLVVERHSLFSDAGWRIHDTLGTPWMLEVNAPAWAERERYEELRRPAWARTWEGEVLRSAPVIVAVSRWLVRWLKEDVGCTNVHWVPNGVQPDTGDRARGRALMKIGDEEPVVGFVGSFQPWHGTERLAGIARAVGGRLVLVGAPDAQVEGATRLGYRWGQDLADIIAAMDVALAPYPADAPPWFCPLKVLDYRAQGTPIVGTDVGEVRALVGEGGTVVPPGDEDALCKAVQAWIGQRVRPRVRSWQTVAREMFNAAGV
jgi:glycosyltransferase involved in cell wall biosynthesis